MVRDAREAYAPQAEAAYLLSEVGGGVMADPNFLREEIFQI